MPLGIYVASVDADQLPLIKRKVKFEVAFEVMGFQQFGFLLIEALLGTTRRNAFERAAFVENLGDSIMYNAIRMLRQEKRPRQALRLRHKDMTARDEADLIEFVRHKDSDGAFSPDDTVRFKKLLKKCRSRCIDYLEERGCDEVYDRILRAFRHACKAEGFVVYSLVPLNEDGSMKEEEDE
jgi:hypothetical protein